MLSRFRACWLMLRFRAIAFAAFFFAFSVDAAFRFSFAAFAISYFFARRQLSCFAIHRHSSLRRRYAMLALRCCFFARRYCFAFFSLLMLSRRLRH